MLGGRAAVAAGALIVGLACAHPRPEPAPGLTAADTTADSACANRPLGKSRGSVTSATETTRKGIVGRIVSSLLGGAVSESGCVPVHHNPDSYGGKGNALELANLD